MPHGSVQDRRRPVPADVEKRPQDAVLAADHQDRFAGDVGGEELPGLRHLFAGRPPARSGEHGRVPDARARATLPVFGNRLGPLQRQVRVEPRKETLEGTGHG